MISWHFKSIVPASTLDAHHVCGLLKCALTLYSVHQLPAVDATTEDGSNCNSQKMLPTLDTDIEDLTGKSLMDM